MGARCQERSRSPEFPRCLRLPVGGSHLAPIRRRVAVRDFGQLCLLSADGRIPTFSPCAGAKAEPILETQQIPGMLPCLSKLTCDCYSGLTTTCSHSANAASHRRGRAWDNLHQTGSSPENYPKAIFMHCDSCYWTWRLPGSIPKIDDQVLGLAQRLGRQHHTSPPEISIHGGGVA